MPSEFICVSSCGNPAEADHLLWLLEQNGVRGFLDGVNANSMMSHVGSALGGVKVFVRADDAELAREIVASAHDASADEAQWYCGACQETVDGNFAICWSCGKPRQEVEQEFPVAASASLPEPESIAEPSPAVEFAASGQAANNPYASPLAAGEPIAVEQDSAAVDDAAEAILRRAWRASILGIAFLPIIMHLFSMCLLIRAALTSQNFSPRGQRLFYGAFAVNIAASAAWGMMFRLMFIPW